MRKFNYVFVVLIFNTLFLSSCVTALKSIPTPQTVSVNNGKEVMEFIGFRNNEKMATSMSFQAGGAFATATVEKPLDLGSDNFGELLERLHLAVNRQHYYTGVYSLQELEIYKATTRYISFVEVLRQHLGYQDYPTWLLAPFGKSNKTYVNFIGEYRLYVYDTQKKQITYTAPMKIERHDIYKGCYSKSSIDDKQHLIDYYSSLFNNMLLENYSKAYRILQSQENEQ